MMDFGWSEMVLILVLALAVIGPRELPKLVRFLSRARRAVGRLVDEAKWKLEELEDELEIKEFREAGKELGLDARLGGNTLRRDTPSSRDSH